MSRQAVYTARFSPLAAGNRRERLELVLAVSSRRINKPED